MSEIRNIIWDMLEELELDLEQDNSASEVADKVIKKLEALISSTNSKE